MTVYLTNLQSLVDQGTFVSKTELIKRYRRIGSVNYYLLQLLCMLQFACIGKDDEGRLYYY